MVETLPGLASSGKLRQGAVWVWQPFWLVYCARDIQPRVSLRENKKLLIINSLSPRVQSFTNLTMLWEFGKVTTIHQSVDSISNASIFYNYVAEIKIHSLVDMSQLRIKIACGQFLSSLKLPETSLNTTIVFNDGLKKRLPVCKSFRSHCLKNKYKHITKLNCVFITSTKCC